MEIDLKNVSKLELLKLLTNAQKTIYVQDKTISKQEDNLCRERGKSAELQRQLELLCSMQFGQKRERFEDPNQIALPLDIVQEVLKEQEEVAKQEITYSRAKKNIREEPSCQVTYRSKK